MDLNQRYLTDVFKESICCVCSLSYVHQYYNINKNYIDYCGKILSLSEILEEALNISLTDYDDVKEICMDCKENVVKFFHFKRKAQENQKHLKSSQLRIKKAQHLPDFNENLVETAISENLQASKSIEESSPIELRLENQDPVEVTIKDEVEEKPEIIYEQFPLVLSQESHISHNSLEYFHRISPSYNQNPDTSESLLESYDDEKDSDYHASNNRGVKLSKAAIKMRKYREKLRLPENREKLLKHLKSQREWNRRSYNRKQGMVTRRKRRNLDDF